MTSLVYDEASLSSVLALLSSKENPVAKFNQVWGQQEVLSNFSPSFFFPLLYLILTIESMLHYGPNFSWKLYHGKIKDEANNTSLSMQALWNYWLKSLHCHARYCYVLLDGCPTFSFFSLEIIMRLILCAFNQSANAKKCSWSWALMKRKIKNSFDFSGIIQAFVHARNPTHKYTFSMFIQGGFATWEMAMVMVDPKLEFFFFSYCSLTTS